MKIFLSSQGVPTPIRPVFLSLFNKKPQDIKLAYIPTAAEVYPLEERGWEQDGLNDVTSTGVALEIIDLKQFNEKPQELRTCLEKYDGVWVSGGHTYFLRYWMRASGFDQIIKELLDEGFVYAGFSAGAMVMGSTLEFFDQFDPEDQEVIEPERIYEGLNFINTAILPHWNNGDPTREAQHVKIMNAFAQNRQKITTLSDHQAIIGTGTDWEVIG